MPPDPTLWTFKSKNHTTYNCLPVCIHVSFTPLWIYIGIRHQLHTVEICKVWETVVCVYETLTRSELILCLYQPITEIHTINTNNQFDKWAEGMEACWTVRKFYLHVREQHLLSSPPFIRGERFHQGDSSLVRLPLLSYLMLFGLRPLPWSGWTLCPVPWWIVEGELWLWSTATQPFWNKPPAFRGATNGVEAWRCGISYVLWYRV